MTEEFCKHSLRYEHCFACRSESKEWMKKFDEEWDDILDKSQDDILDRMQIKSFISQLLLEVIEEIPDVSNNLGTEAGVGILVDLTSIKQQLKSKYGLL